MGCGNSKERKRENDVDLTRPSYADPSMLMTITPEGEAPRQQSKSRRRHSHRKHSKDDS